VVDVTLAQGVTWVHSYVTDERRIHCRYDGPGPKALRGVAADNGLPVDSIMEVRVLDPYLYS
jgi:hypothetical protein